MSGESGLRAAVGITVTTILHCSDAHADSVTRGVDRYDEVEEAFRQTVDAAVREDVDLYLFTGDLCDPDDAPRALRAAALAISVATRLLKAGIPSFWVAGNHDVVNDGSGRTTLSPLRALGTDDVRVFEQPDLVMLPGRPRSNGGEPGFLLALPYPSAGLGYDPAERVRKARTDLGDGKLVVVATHLQVEGATPGSESTEMGRGRDVPFPFAEVPESWLLVGGHYHVGQVFERAARRLTVPGSMIRRNHGEEDARPRYLIWEV